jgi:cytochrome c-type biogenesis protein CcmH/NrfG
MDRIPATLQLFAEASIKTERWTDAAWALEKLLQLQPNHMESWMNLGSVYYFIGQKEPAQACYRRAAQLNPGDPRIKKMLSTL